MTTLAHETKAPRAVSVEITDDTLSVELSDGRSLSVPLAWYPRLAHASPAERAEWRWIAGGEGIHWPAIEEDIAIASLIAGRPSAESPASLSRWLAARKG